jgi:4-diphosphocytidyl-2-C-methyl-D-erythritol kinase
MHRQTRLVLEAPAKINLFLEITGRLPNGYHSLDSVMQAVDLSDLVVVSKAGGSEIRVSCSREDVPLGRGNLAHRAAEAFFAAAGLSAPGLHIHIDKRIPSEAGLGGGSSDAAAVLVGLNALFETGLPPECLCDLGLSVGADVPFLVRGGCARAQGVGEKLTPLSPGLPPCWLAIAKPGEGVSTVKAYAAYDNQKEIIQKQSDEIRESIAECDLDKAAGRLYNRFEQLLALPDLERIKTLMRECGALGAALTGSGSAVYGIFPKRAAAEACHAALEEHQFCGYLARPAEYGARIVHTG